MLRRKLFDTTGSRVDALKQLIEIRTAMFRDNDFAVDYKPISLQFLESGHHFRKISIKRFAGFGLEGDFLGITKGNATEAVPFWFVLPFSPCGKFRHKHRFHR